MSWLLVMMGIYAYAGGQPVPAVTLKGKLIAVKTKTPVAGAMISLADMSGTGGLQPAFSDSTGRFTFRVSPGIYQLKVESLNFKTWYLTSLNIARDTSLGQLLLEEDARQLQTVNVTALKSDIELKADKKVFNVGRDIISKGGNATDILNNVPSVGVDLNGAVSLRGNENVRILINGKPSMLTLSNGLQQIPASSIEKVEVITNPSAAYESQGSAGIINIVLKKNSGYGFNASLQAGAGSPANNSVNLNMSYKTAKVNVFSNIGYRYMEILREQKMHRISYDKGGNSTLRQLNTGNISFGNTNLYLGGDYYINDRNTLTASYYRTNIDNKNDIRYDYNYFGSTDKADSSITRQEDYREPQRFNELELNYVKTFAKKDRKWTTNLQYDFWNDDENQDIRQQKTLPWSDAISRLITRDIESSKDIFVQSDYVTPLKKNGRLEAGMRAALRAIRSEYTAAQDGKLLEQYDNKLKYDENIYAAYAQYHNRLGKISYLAGLRSELSDIRIADRKGSFDNHKRYINFFPTLHLQYSLKHELDLQLNYSRRINRPQFWQLNPFAGLSDTRYLSSGNPDLDPMYTHSLEAGLLKKIGGLTINPSVYFQYSTNYFEYILRQTAAGYFISIPVNLDHEKRYGADVAITYNPLPWWRLSTDFNYYRFSQQGAYEGKTYQSDNETWFATFRSGMKFPKIVSMDLSLNYRGRKKNIQMDVASQYRANAGLSKDLWNDRVSLSFTVNNIFDSWRSRQVTQTPAYFLDDELARPGRYYVGTVVYRLNRKKDQADRLPEDK